MRIERAILLTAACLTAFTQAAASAAQLPDPAAAALAISESHAASVRGFAAIAANPAGLGMPAGPQASGTFLSVRGVGGLGPVGLEDLSEYGGEELPDEVRRSWLERIARVGGERGNAGADLTYIAAQFGRVGIQIASAAEIEANVGPGAAELVLFGNAGRTGSPADIALENSSFDLAVTSTFALAYGHPLVRTAQRSVSLGATAKYTIGHLMMTALDLGGGATADPLAIGFEFPIVQTDTAVELGTGNRGSGVGLDVGLAWREGSFLAGLTVRNVFNTFKWDEEQLFFRPGTVAVGEEARATDFEVSPYAFAPEAVRSRVEDLGYSPIVAAGAAYELSGRLRLSGQLRQRLGDGRPGGPATHLASGVEYRPLRWLPLRAGAALTSAGHQLSGGLGLHVGAAHLDAAAARRSTDLGTATVGMLTFSLSSP